jgi:hypothetical protein
MARLPGRKHYSQVMMVRGIHIVRGIKKDKNILWEYFEGGVDDQKTWTLAGSVLLWGILGWKSISHGTNGEFCSFFLWEYSASRLDTPVYCLSMAILQNDFFEITLTNFIFSNSISWYDWTVCSVHGYFSSEWGEFGFSDGPQLCFCKNKSE